MKRRRSEVDSNDYVIVNFKGVGSRNIVAVGDYRAMVTKVTKGISKPGNPKLDWIFTVTAGPEEGHRFMPYVTSLLKTSLWNLRAVLEALGVEVPESDLQIVFGELKGLELGLTIEHENYEKRVKERIVDLFPLEELGGEEEVEEGEEEVEEEKSPEKFSETEMKKMEKGEMPKDRLMSNEEALELRRREEAAALVKEVKQQTETPKKIKIEEETEEEEEEEEDE